jgi:D-serine deaminase-like pyridoxal phosphate-dependent protein
MVSRSVGGVSGGTPYVLIDGAKMESNLLKMADVAGENGVALRPHVKTHKIPGIAREQLEAGAAGITVAKLSEAEVMADGGIEDIFIAYPLVTEAKIRQAIRLGEMVRLVVGVDSLEGARRLSAVAEGHTLEVRLEVDTGLRRTGVLYDEAVGRVRSRLWETWISRVSTLTAVPFLAAQRRWSSRSQVSKRANSWSRWPIC